MGESTIVGNPLNELKRHEEAPASFDKAIALKPDYAEAHNNRGNALNELKRFEEAQASCYKAIAQAGTCRGAQQSRKYAQRAKALEEALASYDRAIALKPDFKFLYGSLIRTKMRVCDWSNLETQIAQLIHTENRQDTH